jgi:hypothetical protein
MYDKIERLTAISIGRGVGFGALTVICFMVGFASSWASFLRAGGLGALLICMVLAFKCLNSRPDLFRRTEVWIMLDKHERPPSEVAAAMISAARRSIMLRWAERAAWAAAIMLSLALFMMLVP